MWHPLENIGARAKIVIFLARVRAEYVHLLGTCYSANVYHDFTLFIYNNRE